MTENQMDKEQKERYVRWQEYRITQLSNSTNLFLGFAAASLAYAINLKLSGSLHSNISLEQIIIWWAISALFGCLSTITKLLDYRFTARKIRYSGQFNTFMANNMGCLTWVFLWIQIITYAIGAYLFIKGTIAQ